LSELAAERDAAERACDLGRSERAAREIEALQTELERALGLGGRERKWGATSERARSNVQRRIAHAIEQVRCASARLGEHLGASVRTGTYCSYTPPTAARRRPRFTPPHQLGPTIGTWQTSGGDSHLQQSQRQQTARPNTSYHSTTFRDVSR
jgi:hypothetical protein